MTISTHVLDATTGRPAAGMGVVLRHRSGDDGWVEVAAATTDSDGRIQQVTPKVVAGDYRLEFDTAGYLAETFYPEVVIVFRVTDPAAHHHVPLLLSPYAYSTYRGS